MNKLQKIAEETIAAIDAEKYINPSGKNMSIKNLVDFSVRKSKLYRPNETEEITKALGTTRSLNTSPEIVVTRESSLEAAARARGRAIFERHTGLAAMMIAPVRRRLRSWQSENRRRLWSVLKRQHQATSFGGGPRWQEWRYK